MGHLIRSLTHTGYTRIAKPLLFRRAPDDVHRNTMKLGHAIGRFKPARIAVRWALAYHHPMLEQTLHSIPYKNPVGLAAGIDKNVQVVPMMEAIGFGHTTGGSITGHSCAGNPRPWFHRLPELKAIAVHAGLGNQGSIKIARRLHTTEKDTVARTIPLTLSVARTNTKETKSESEGIADYILALKTLRSDADVFELNISCPNTYGGEPFTTPSKLDRLLSAIETLELTQPLYIKMPSNLEWTDYDALLKCIVKHSVQGVTICNLRKDRSGMNVSETIKGGISGKPIQASSDELVEKTYRAYGDKLTIIGVGGIFTAEDAYRKVKRGASLVELATGLIYEGPAIPGMINRGLVKLLKADGYSHISEAIGADVTPQKVP